MKTITRNSSGASAFSGMIGGSGKMTARFGLMKLKNLIKKL